MSQNQQKITPEIVITTAHNCLLQLYAFTKNEIAAGNASKKCEESIRMTLVNLQILANRIAPRVAARLGEQPAQDVPVATNLPAVASVSTQT